MTTLDHDTRSGPGTADVADGDPLVDLVVQTPAEDAGDRAAIWRALDRVLSDIPWISATVTEAGCLTIVLPAHGWDVARLPDDLTMALHHCGIHDVLPDMVEFRPTYAIVPDAGDEEPAPTTP